ncbi:hypothetical protein B6D12_12740 [Gilliamella apicola]|uniref:acyl carrier protein n=1 Tax=Gilliamella apicola TaxID=1196095 RepID=UPI000A346680|nr:acyl carrier protein [Gilliamella apicola]OTP87374.1 hypothetical protein B5S41_12325 [Gilliamella apicola]OTP92355.1 hypothetical protein B6D13_12840 [Gilliamella apicola]OTP98757.1 hypothetical protein B6D07_12790 [Gilliamella apicola]OTQ03871.1 hypothetical protein B6D12_12740 [Gilliamella apicola]OTQ26263.1 hypothetical protein B6D02_11940 [Gilliamella apicola]
MTNVKNIKNEIVSLLVNNYGIDNENLTNGVTFQQLGIDSIVILDIHFDIEQKFEIDIPEGDINVQQNLTDLVCYLENRNK